MNNAETVAALRAEAQVHQNAARRLNQTADGIATFEAQADLYSTSNKTAELARIKAAVVSDLDIATWDGVPAPVVEEE
jgi:hypothetical protein